MPNERSSHNSPIVKGAGVLFFISFLTADWFHNYQYLEYTILLFLIALIGFLDDLYNLSSKTRLLLEFIIFIAFIHYYFESNLFYLQLLFLIFAVGVINSFNFMDGINGILGLYSLAILISIYLINNKLSSFIINDYIIICALSVVVFLLFNFKSKALAFAGDVGSLSISFILIFFLVQIFNKTDNLVYFSFMSIFGIDTFFTLLIRIKNKENLSIAHRKHLYQKLKNELAINPLIISTYFAISQLLSNITIIHFYFDSIIQIKVTIFILIVQIIIYLLIRNWVSKRIKNITVQ